MISNLHQMLAAEARTSAARRTLRRAVAFSLLLHAAVLFFHLLFPALALNGGRGDSPLIVQAPLRATLAQRARPLAENSQPATATIPQKGRRSRQDTRTHMTRSGPGQRSAAAPAPDGSDLAERALAMARRGINGEPDVGTDSQTTRQEGKGTQIEPFSLQMYFDSFIRKLNRSAAFVKREPRKIGRQRALVEIQINPNGSLKNYRILRAADQQAEIEFIRQVVELAVPFAAFPPDIRQGTDTLSLKICIHPPDDAGGSFGFSRTSGGDC